MLLSEAFSQGSKIKKSLVVGMIIVAAFSRLIPHSPNFTSVGAMALFAGSAMGLSLASFLVPAVVMLLTDLVLGMHPTMIFVYGAFALTVVLGAVLLKNSARGVKLLSVSLAASLLFFFITNLGVWLVGGYYTGDLKGLVECYIMALPFFKNQVTGDLMYSVLIFYGFQFAVNTIEKRISA